MAEGRSSAVAVWMTIWGELCVRMGWVVWEMGGLGFSKREMK